MKILYAIQGTGNGHITRSLEILPHLMKNHKVDILVSGSQWEIKLPYTVRYRMKGMGFVFGKKGGVDVLKTFLELNTRNLIREISSLPVREYDMVISDFEPVSVWACRKAGKASVGLSNQAAVLHPLAPKPDFNDPFGISVIKYYAKATHNYGFHFKALDSTVFTPIIRRKIRESRVSNEGHVTVYLPSFEEEHLIRRLNHVKSVPFHVFSKRVKNSYRHGNFSVHPLNEEHFIKSMSSAYGVITQAGFGTTSEALFLGKKLLVIPMKKQFEQHCNAAMLESMGVTVTGKLKKSTSHLISEWIDSGKPCEVYYPDQTASILDMIMQKHQESAAESPFHDIGWDETIERIFLPPYHWS